jgi:Protein of unknown function (DUF2817)
MDSFSNSYAEARAKFVAAASAANARIYNYGRSDLVGSEGERLTCDIAVFGEDTTDIAVIVITGTHGVEGYCGSAILHSWLTSQVDNTLTENIKIVLVHAINPWAFSHNTRTTENNVDLNRNFLLNRASYERHNLSYDKLVPFLHVKSYSADQNLINHKAYKAFLDQHGWHIENEMLQGQTHRADGLFYAGKQPEWANLTFRKIVNEHLSSANTIGFVDWHTGVGSYGEVVHLIFDDKGSAEHAAATHWWGVKGTDGRAFNSGTVPKYEGLLCNAIRQELAKPRIAGGVIEFGTADDYGMFRADCLDRWLRFEGRDDKQYNQFRDDYRNANCPIDVAWRRLVLREGPMKIDQLIHGVSTWHA